MSGRSRRPRARRYCAHAARGSRRVRHRVGERDRRARSPRASPTRAQWSSASTAPTATSAVPADVERAVGDAVERHGRIDVVVNSAGVREIGDSVHAADRGVGQRDRRQPERHVLRLPGRGAADARDRRRLDRQHRLRRRPDRPRPPARVHRVEARRRRTHEEPRARPRSRRHPRERDLPRPDPHAAHRVVLRRRPLRAEPRDRPSRRAATARRATSRTPRSISRASSART